MDGMNVDSGRPYGTGYVETRTGRDGTVRYRARFPDRGRHISIGTFDSEDAAQRALNGAVKASLIAAAPGATTLREAGEALLSKLDQMERRGSERSYWAHIVSAPFIDSPMDTISAIEIQDWLEIKLARRKKTRAKYVGGKVERSTLAEAISFQTCVHVKNLMSRIFARNKKAVPVNPVFGLSIPKPSKKRDDDWTYLNNEELALLEAGAGVGELQRNTFMFAACSGLRQGELCGLRRTDCHVDAAQPFVRVRFSFEGSTKSGKDRWYR
jgi:integrase